MAHPSWYETVWLILMSLMIATAGGILLAWAALA
jgi:hypothetical protein